MKEEGRIEGEMKMERGGKTNQGRGQKQIKRSRHMEEERKRD